MHALRRGGETPNPKLSIRLKSSQTLNSLYLSLLGRTDNLISILSSHFATETPSSPPNTSTADDSRYIVVDYPSVNLEAYATHCYWKMTRGLISFFKTLADP